MPGTNFTAYGTKTGITNAYVVADAVPLTAVAALKWSEKVPRKCQLRSVRICAETRAGGAAALTFFLSSDANGDRPLTGEVTVSMVGGLTTAAQGGSVAVFAAPVKYEYDSTLDADGVVYMHAKWDAGTGDVRAWLGGDR